MAEETTSRVSPVQHVADGVSASEAALPRPHAFAATGPQQEEDVLETREHLQHRMTTPCAAAAHPHVAHAAPAAAAHAPPRDSETGLLPPDAPSPSSLPAAAPPAPAPFRFPHRRPRAPPSGPTPSSPLPALLACRHFVNLTSGIEALPTLHALGIRNYTYVRLQSTACEQGHLEALLLSLDAHLLMSLALGHCCLVWDLGSRDKEVAAPRALWYGLEFVRYTLYREWLGRRPRVHLRGREVSAEFDGRLDAMQDATLAKIRYYKRWVAGGTSGGTDGTAGSAGRAGGTAGPQVASTLIKEVDGSTGGTGGTDSAGGSGSTGGMGGSREVGDAAGDTSGVGNAGSTACTGGTELRLYGVYRATCNDAVPGLCEGILQVMGERADSGSGGKSGLSAEAEEGQAGAGLIGPEGGRSRREEGGFGEVPENEAACKAGCDVVDEQAGSTGWEGASLQGLQGLGSGAVNGVEVQDGGGCMGACGRGSDASALPTAGCRSSSEQQLLAHGFRVHFRGLDAAEWDAWRRPAVEEKRRKWREHRQRQQQRPVQP